jgi:hypothetical protein
MVKNEKGKKLALCKQTKVESSSPSPPHSRASIDVGDSSGSLPINYDCKPLPFYSMCIFEGSSPTKEPQSVMLVISPNFICSHVPMEEFHFYKMGKKPGNKRRIVYIRGSFGTHAFS